MHYINIQDPTVQYTFAETVMLGVPPTGGSFWPTHIPRLPDDFVERWQNLSFTERATQVVKLFAPELSEHIIAKICADAFDNHYFYERQNTVTHGLNDYQNREFFTFLDRGPTGTYHDFIVGFQMSCLRHLAGEQGGYVLCGPNIANMKAMAVQANVDELWHPIFLADQNSGDQFAFKELKSLWQRPLSCAEYTVADPLTLMQPTKEKRGVATGLLDADFMEEISREQAKFGGKYNSENQKRSEELLEGVRDNTGERLYTTADDLSDTDLASCLSQVAHRDLPLFLLKGKPQQTEQAVYTLLSNLGLRQELAEQQINLSCVDQHTFSAVLAEVIILISAYIDLRKNPHFPSVKEMRLAVPAPDFDWTVASMLATKMGLAIENTIVATDRNRLASEFLTTGVYNINRRFVRTNTPSLDHVYSPNLWRLIYMISDGNSEVIAQVIEKMKLKGQVRLQVGSKKRKGIYPYIFSNFIDTKEVSDVLREYYDMSDYLFDPVTGVLLAVTNRYFNHQKSPILYVVTENALLSAKMLARTLFSAKELKYKTYNEILNRLALETSVPIPRAAYSGSVAPSVSEIYVDELVATIKELLTSKGN